jgi:hypothetical protein
MSRSLLLFASFTLAAVAVVIGGCAAPTPTSVPGPAASLSPTSIPEPTATPEATYQPGGAVVSGRVEDGSTGLPLAGSAVAVVGYSATAPMWFYIDDQGRTVSADLAPIDGNGQFLAEVSAEFLDHVNQDPDLGQFAVAMGTEADSVYLYESVDDTQPVTFTLEAGSIVDLGTLIRQ